MITRPFPLPPRVAVACLATVLLPARERPPEQPSPGPRNAHAVVYDLRDRSLVLFGGAGADAVRGDTWRWKAGRWRRVSGSGPDPRTFPAMAYDSARDETVLFGGNRVLFGDATHPPALLGDTWVLRGDRWARAAHGGPSPRAEAAVAYDAGRERTVLFGGYGVAPDGGRVRLGDTWEWDGRGWTRVSGTGPPARSGAAAAYDPARGGVVLFGGSGGPLGDTWLWDGREWRPLPVPAAPGRFNPAMAREPHTGRLLRFAGWDGSGRVADLWQLCQPGWRQLEVDAPTPAARNHAVLASASDRGSLLLYGGHDGSRVFADLWELKDGRWFALESAEPVLRVENGH